MLGRGREFGSGFDEEPGPVYRAIASVSERGYRVISVAAAEVFIVSSAAIALDPSEERLPMLAAEAVIFGVALAAKKAADVLRESRRPGFIGVMAARYRP